MTADDAAMTITITPEPTVEELAAIVSAVTAALREGTQGLPYNPAADRLKPSRWVTQGRREAMRGLDQAVGSDGLGR